MFAQFLFIIGGILMIPLTPLLIWQGKKVKATVPRLSEAINPQGIFEQASTDFIKVLALGESTFAGVGVDTHQEGIIGKFASRLSQLYQKSVVWEVVAKSGFSAQKVFDELVPIIPDTPFDLILIGLGGNDTFELNSPKKWHHDLKQLLQILKKRQPQAVIVIANLPPVGQFPAFPPPLNWVLGGLTALHTQIARQLAPLFEQIYFHDEKFIISNPQEMFSDGVHPSGKAYQIWGESIAQFIYQKQLI